LGAAAKQNGVSPKNCVKVVGVGVSTFGGAGSDEEARARLAAIGEIAAEVAHELRNALQVISASAYLARLDPAASLPHVQKIERNARLAHGIVDDLMGLARGDALHAEPVPVVELAMAARSDLAATWTDDVAPSDLKARVHVGLVTRLLHVLYENAIGASAPRVPAIATHAFARGDGRVCIEVSDDGPGVPPEIAARVFEPLVTARGGGTGLGLALATRIAASHGGTLTLAPPEPGKGATFRLELPGTR
jgi:signal transduction histidine kinase